MRQRFRPARLLASVSLIALLAASLGGCTAMSKLSDVTGSIGPRAEAAPADPARAYYASALKIAPGDPGVLSNLGLSYMLSRDLPKAEEALRQAYASPRASSRVRQNLGLVVGLQGRFAEAETIVKADLPPDQAA